MPFAKGNPYAFKAGNEIGKLGGRPRMSDTEKEAARLARENAKRAMDRVLSLIDSEDEKLQLAAAKEVLDRAMGKPTTTLAGDPDKPINAKVTFGWKSKSITSPETVSSLGTTESKDGASLSLTDDAARRLAGLMS